MQAKALAAHSMEVAAGTKAARAKASSLEGVEAVAAAVAAALKAPCCFARITTVTPATTTIPAVSCSFRETEFSTAVPPLKQTVPSAMDTILPPSTARLYESIQIIYMCCLRVLIVLYTSSCLQTYHFSIRNLSKACYNHLYWLLPFNQ
jgi:hypothetical protein